MRKIVFIEPKSPNLHIFSQFLLPRLGIFILGAIAKKKGWDAEVIVEQSQKIDYEKLRSTDMVGISTITPTAPRAYAIADKLRSSGVPVVMGGPHVTFLPEEGLEHADYVIRGEAEEAFNNFLETWQNGKQLSEVPNLSFKIGNAPVHNPLKPLSKPLDANPFPDFNLSRSMRRKLSGRTLTGQTIIPVQTSRGCPFHCSFCSVTGMFGKTYRFRSTENIIQELRLYNHKKNSIFFYDDNFTANRKRAKELLQRMIEEEFKFQWSTQVRVDIAKDPELVRLMKKAGCKTLYIGFESVNPKSLESMKKNQTVDEMAQAIRILRRQRIHIHGMFVYGFDEDDWRTVKETVRFAKRAKLTSTQFMILTPLPGSEFYDRVTCENRIQFRDWTLYDAHHAVFKSIGLTLFELQRAQRFSHSKFYSFMEIIRRGVSFSWVDFGVAIYGNKLNRLWKKKNKTFLKVMELFRSKDNVKVDIDYRERVLLDEETAGMAM